MTSHPDDVKIIRHHDVTSLAVSIKFLTFGCYSVVLKMSLSMRKIWGSIPRPVKSDIV